MPGAEDEHGQDARALRVDGDHVALREQVDDALGCSQRDERGEQREDPQHRAAIGQQQEDDDDDAGGEQQPAVDAGEGRREVAVDARRPGQLDRQTVVVAVGAELVAHVGDDVGECVPTRLADVDGDEDLQRLAVLGLDRVRSTSSVTTYWMSLTCSACCVASSRSASVMPPGRS